MRLPLIDESTNLEAFTAFAEIKKGGDVSHEPRLEFELGLTPMMKPVG
jgi:hypothetical protein